MTSDGILLVAHTSAAYWPEVAALCRSIRAVSHGVSVALATDLGISDSEARNAGFTEIVRGDFREFGGVSCKVRLLDLSPFSGRTLFIDSDAICYRDIAGIFGAFNGHSFVTLGNMASSTYWFKDSEKIKSDFAIDRFPFFVGDFYLFDRSSLSRSIFDMAADLARSHQQIGIHPLGGWCNDEPAFSIAMAQHGVAPLTGRGEWIEHLQAPGLTVQHIDYKTRTARITIDGEERSPAIIHYGVYRTQPLYYREKFLVNHGETFGVATRAIASVVGVVESVRERTRRRLRRLMRPPSNAFANGAVP